MAYLLTSHDDSESSLKAFTVTCRACGGHSIIIYDEIAYDCECCGSDTRIQFRCQHCQAQEKAP